MKVDNQIMIKRVVADMVVKLVCRYNRYNRLPNSKTITGATIKLMPNT